MANKCNVPNGWADAITVGQAFHWFANLEALEEFHRVLKPLGVLALVWNLEDQDVSFVKELRETYEEYEGDVPQYRHGVWKEAFQVTDIFSPLQTSFYNHTTVYLFFHFRVYLQM